MLEIGCSTLKAVIAISSLLVFLVTLAYGESQPISTVQGIDTFILSGYPH